MRRFHFVFQSDQILTFDWTSKVAKWLLSTDCHFNTIKVKNKWENKINWILLLKWIVSYWCNLIFLLLMSENQRSELLMKLEWLWKKRPLPSNKVITKVGWKKAIVWGSLKIWSLDIIYFVIFEQNTILVNITMF